MTFTLQIDPDYKNKLGKAGQALNKAIVTDAATFAKEEYVKEVKSKLERPSTFTTSPTGYGVIFAKFGAPTARTNHGGRRPWAGEKTETQRRQKLSSDILSQSSGLSSTMSPDRR